MKRLWLITGLGGLLLAVPAQADITVGDYTYDGTVGIGLRPAGYGTGPGGAFQITTGAGLETVVGSSFLSFCIERNEYINLPGNYYGNVNSAAVEGGVGPAGDPISLATAYLYAEFRRGTLSGYTYGSNESANELQDAFWYLEGEGGVKNSFVTTARDALHLTDTTVLTTDANGEYGVVVLNLYDAAHNLHQDQLALAVPEPSTVMAGLLLLLPLGVSTVRILRRNKAA